MSALNFVSRKFPARIADLGFSVRLPAGWKSHDLTEENPDFTNPVTFVPLTVITAPHSVMVFTFAARPAYDDGTLVNWAHYLLEQNRLKPSTLGAGNVGVHEAIIGEAVTDTDLGAMRVRYAFLEDGGRLINITFSAPEELADSMSPAWAEMLQSFKLDTPRGAAVAAPAQEQEKEPEKERVPRAFTAPTESRSVKNKRGSKKLKFADFALADDEASFAAEHPVNANLLNRGAGFPAEITASDAMGKRAYLKSGAIRAELSAPFGWHAMDDGRRLLVFDAANQVQINLDLIARDGRTEDAILDAIEAEARQNYPNAEFLRVGHGRIQALGMRNIHDGKQPLEQYHMLVRGPGKQSVLRARVTTWPEHAARACNLAELILNSVKFGAFPDPESSSSPPDRKHAWEEQSAAYDAAGDFAGAAEAIAGGVAHATGSKMAAEMYAAEMQKRLRACDQEGALAAFRDAERWMQAYAAQATSGGEGALYGAELRRFRKHLVETLGRDPDKD
jgi:hypothetical protein